MPISDKILHLTMSLTHAEKAELIDRLLASMDTTDQEIDQLWLKEAEDRIQAYEQSKMKSVSLEEILEHYKEQL